MFDTLKLVQLAQDAARHAGQRQALAATNVANADTPGYRARDVADFATVHRAAGLRQTRAGHIAPSGSGAGPRIHEADQQGALTPNGNSVSLELEMLRSVDAERQHSRAVAVYDHSLKIMRAALGRR